MSSPKPTPTRRGTLFGLRRKSSAGLLVPTASAPNAEATSNGEPSGQSIPQEPTISDVFSATTIMSPPKPKRGFSILPARPSVDDNAALLSDSGSDRSLNVNAKASTSAGRGFLRRLSSTKKHAIGELTQEKKDLEVQVQVLSSEKSSLEAALEAARDEAKRLSLEAGKVGDEQNAERRMIWDEAAAQLVEKEGEVKSLAAAIDELKEELERTKASEQELLSHNLLSTLDLQEKMAEMESRVRNEVKEEKETLEAQLLEAQSLIDAKDRTIKELEAQASGIQEQLRAAELLTKRLKEEKADWEARKESQVAKATAPASKPLLSGWCSYVFSWFTYGAYVGSIADESAHFGLSRHPSCLYLS